jgi:dCTP deaminase
MGGCAVSVLTKDELQVALDEDDLDKKLFVAPLLDPDQVGTASIDLRLGTEFLLLRRTREAGLDPCQHPPASLEAMQERLTVPLGDSLWLHPRHFALAVTLEYLRLPADLSAYVIGRSTWGRVGLLVATAIMVHPGFTGCLTLELVNDGDSPIRLYPGTRIAQLAVHRTERPTTHLYGPKNRYFAPIRPHPAHFAAETGDIERVGKLADALEGRVR